MRRAWRLTSAIALILAACSMLLSAWLFKLNADRVDQINTERARNTTSSCLAASEQNRAILQYLENLGGTPAQIREAARFFPVRTARECKQRARKQVTP